MTKKSNKGSFDPAVFLATAKLGRSIFDHAEGHVVFSQGDPADAVFYLKKGNVKIAVTSEQGKEAILGILGEGEFFGELKKNGREPVMLTTPDQDAGMVPSAKAEAEAQQLANQTGEVVSIRDHISDKLIASLTPKKKADQAAEAKRLSKGVKVTKVAPTAKELTEASSKLKGKKAAKAKSAKSKASKPKADAQPEGKSAECIRLALRKNGVTPAELNEFTGWKGAPWRWLYSNPKNNGWADRFGYKLEVLREGRAVHYRLTPR